MRAEATFTVASFEPTNVHPDPAIETALPVGVVRMQKQLTGTAQGRTATIFVFAFDQATGTGTYVAMESFEGSLFDRSGTFNFVHSASTDGTGSRDDEHFVIVAGSGTGELRGITGNGGLVVEAGGAEKLWFDFELPG